MKKTQQKIFKSEIIIIFVLILITLLPQLIGTTKSQTDSGSITSISDLNGKKLDEIYSKWFSSGSPTKTTAAKPKSDGSKGELKITSCLDWSPFCYQKNSEPQGFFLDIANEFCAWAGYTPVYEFADIQSSLAGFEAGKYDMFAYGFIDMPERQEQGYFSTPLYGEGIML